MHAEKPTSEPVAIPTVSFPPRRKKDVLIALPWYKSCSPLTSFSVMGLIDRTRTAIAMNFGDAYVVHSRNTLADVFLQSKAEWMITVDDDMVVPFGQGKWLKAYCGLDLPKPFFDYHTVDRLLSHGKTLVGALYFGRWRHGAAMFAEGMRDKNMMTYLRRGPRDEIQPTKWVGTGCMLIHRTVFEDIEKKFSYLARKRDDNTRGGNWFTPSEHELAGAVDKAAKALEGRDQGSALEAQRILLEAKAKTRSDASLGTGEDVIFCNRARVSGHQPYVDLGLICGHVGHDVYTPYNTT